MFAIDAQQTVLGVWHSQGSARAHQQQLQLVQAAEARQRPAVIKPQERLFLHADGCELGECRVDQGDRSPRPPTDPDVRDYRIRLLESRARFRTTSRMNHVSRQHEDTAR